MVVVVIKSAQFSPSMRASFASFSLLCWNALLGSNLRRRAPGSFDRSCSKSLFCLFTTDWSFDISYKHTQWERRREGKRKAGIGETCCSAKTKKRVCGTESRRAHVCFTRFKALFSSFNFITCLIFCFWFWWPSRCA